MANAMQRKLESLSQRLIETEQKLSRQAICVETLQDRGLPSQRAEEVLNVLRRRVRSLRTSHTIVERRLAAISPLSPDAVSTMEMAVSGQIPEHAGVQ